MLTHAQLVALDRSLREERVLSVYLHGGVDDPAARLVWRRELDRSLKDLRRWLAGSSHQEREAFEQSVRLLEEQLAPFAAGLPAPGWAAFITAGDVRYAEQLPVPMPTMAVWSTGMCVSPYIRALKVAYPVIVALADAREARIYRYHAGALEHLETVHAHATIEAPSHMGEVPRAGFHPGVRGETAHDATQRALTAGTERMLKHAETAVARYAGRDGLVLTGGPAAVSAHLTQTMAERLPGRVRELVSLDVRASHAEVASAARAGASALRDETDHTRLLALISGNGSDQLVALGPADTRHALEQACVRELYITLRYIEDHTAEAEEAVRQALDQGAMVETVTRAAADELDRHGGLCARLRYRLARRSEPVEADADLALSSEGGTS